MLVWSPVASSASTGRPSRPAEDPGDQADNHTTIIGNLVDDPEVRFTNNGTAVANLQGILALQLRQPPQRAGVIGELVIRKFRSRLHVSPHGLDSSTHEWNGQGN
jgi:hypothetical protein